MEEKTIATVTGGPMAVEVMDLELAKRQLGQLQLFVKNQMREDVDFGQIPGCHKPSLFKPGAEKLLFFHGLGCRLEAVSPDTIADWKTPFFNYCYRATVYSPRTGHVIATAEGSCNSQEKKYKERDAKDMVNTFQKMAQKRAMVAATLMACRASDIFTEQEEPEDGNTATGDQKKDANPKPPISDAQRKRLFAIMKDCGVEEEALAQHLREKYPYTLGDDDQPHSSKLSWKNDDYNAVVNWLEGQRKK